MKNKISRQEARKSGSFSVSTNVSQSPTFTKNFEMQALSLKEALNCQVQATKIKREELKDLNNRFDVEVSTRRTAEAEVVELQNKLAILQSKVKGLELQAEKETGNGNNTRRTSKKPLRTLPDMTTIRKIHSFRGGSFESAKERNNSPNRPHTPPKLKRPPPKRKPISRVSVSQL